MTRKEELEAAMRLYKEFLASMNGWKPFVYWLDSQLKPAPQEWECVKTIQLFADSGTWYSFHEGSRNTQLKWLYYGIDLSLFPNHFRKIESKIDLVKELTQDSEPERYTMAEAAKELESWLRSAQCREPFYDITMRMKQSAQTETNYREVIRRIWSINHEPLDPSVKEMNINIICSEALKEGEPK